MFHMLLENSLILHSNSTKYLIFLSYLAKGLIDLNFFFLMNLIDLNLLQSKVFFFLFFEQLLQSEVYSSTHGTPMMVINRLLDFFYFFLFCFYVYVCVSLF